MLVWVNVVYSAKLVSEVVRPVRCEHCRTEYVYKQKLVSVAKEGRAFGIGEQPDFRQKLATDQEDQQKETFVPVPCPVCFRYPDYMVEWLQSDLDAERFASGMLYLIGAVLVAGLAWFLGAIVRWEVMTIVTWVAAGFLALMTAIYALLWYRCRYYDPNADRYLTERREEAEEEAMTRDQFEAQESEETRKSLEDWLEIAEERPGNKLDPVQVPVWLGFRTTLHWKKPSTGSVTLPTGEVYEFELPDEAKEFDSFDLKREVDGTRIVFRCVLRFYHPTHIPKR